MNFEMRRKPQQTRSKQKVDSILDTVEELAIETGLKGLTTTNIAAMTGIAVGTIYQYFGNRTELLLAAEMRMFERLAERLYKESVNVLAEPAQDPIKQLIHIYLKSARAEPGYLPLLKFSVLNKPPGVNEAVVEEFAGDIIRACILLHCPDLNASQMFVTQRTVVSILAVLTDVVLLEPDPKLQKRFEAEMVAQCKYAVQRAGEANGAM
ncbi:MAG: TetR/AcrR family transcriptional regulator [Pseudomonadota bacterium]